MKMTTIEIPLELKEELEHLANYRQQSFTECFSDMIHALEAVEECVALELLAHARKSEPTGIGEAATKKLLAEGSDKACLVATTKKNMETEIQEQIVLEMAQVALPKILKQDLEAEAKLQGLSFQKFFFEILIEKLEDLEDLRDIEQMERSAETYSLEDLEQEFGL